MWKKRQGVLEGVFAGARGAEEEQIAAERIDKLRGIMRWPYYDSLAEKSSSSSGDWECESSLGTNNGRQSPQHGHATQ